jgi:uncharacterized repeat protein (TIGR03837 family)
LNLSGDHKNMARWDVFCKVVDNYGDIGACWRLARQLVAEHEADVRLWVDQLETFARICPAVATTTDQQRVDQIEICRWRPDFPEVEAADVVIETFGCELPDNYIAAMVRRNAAPAWINLEYLSAEAWVEGCHRLPSLRTRGPLDKYFFFPGFTPRTGGVLRERDLNYERAAFDSAAETAFWRSVGVPERNPAAGSDRELRVSMFCYNNAFLPELLQCWAGCHRPVTVLAAPGPATGQIADWFGEPLVAGKVMAGTPLRRAALSVYPLPFLPPPRFDRLLWACDVNFVRGEDSFVRAQWARRPFVWQIYPQAEEVHFVKLEAFLGRYLGGCEASAAVRECWLAWNGKGHVAAAWPDFAAILPAVEQHGKVWASTLDQNGDLADNLVRFVREISVF